MKNPLTVGYAGTTPFLEARQLIMEQKGKRFSLVYLERGAPARDDQRFRNRLAAYYLEHIHDRFGDGIRKALQREAGIHVPLQAYRYRVDKVLKEGDLRDVLDSITIIYHGLINQGHRGLASGWKHFVSKTLLEENVGYILDEHAGVHYFIDEDFERNTASTLAVLEQARYGGVRAAVEDAYRHLENSDTKASVRSIFEALEILAKQIVETKNLNKWIVENTLKGRYLSLYQGDPIGAKVAAGMFDSLAPWVDAIHNYRHGQPNEEPVAPDESLCVHVLSTGSSYIRWLAELADQLPPPASAAPSD